MSRLEGQPSYSVEPMSWDLELLAYGPQAIDVGAVTVDMTGIATTANQATEIASLASIDGKLPAALESGRLKVSLPAGGSGLTDTELRATAVPVSGPLTDTQLRAVAVPVSGTVTVNPGSVFPVSDNGGSLTVDAANLDIRDLTFAADKVDASGTVLGAGTANIGDVDVLSLPALPAGANTIGAVTNANLDVALSTRLKPADTLAAVTNLAQLGGAAIAMGTGVRAAGVQRVTVATDDVVPVVGPALTKGTQGAAGFSTQDLKDAGRNLSHLFMVAGIAGTAAEVMQSLTGYKSGAAVVATATPAVVSAGKTFRVTSITLSYQSLAAAGGCLFRLRANLAGAAVIGSPLVAVFHIGSAAAVAGVLTTLNIPFPDGLEFAAGTGIAVGMLGINTVGAAAASGFGTITINGYEY